MRIQELGDFPALGTGTLPGMISHKLRNRKHQGSPKGSEGKESAWSAGDPGSTPGLGRSRGGGNGYPLQNSCLENPIDGGAWRAAIHGVVKESESDTTE